jgi:hypothetical protein
MNTSMILKAVLLMKGDANYVQFGGAMHKTRYPPADSINPDPNGLDLPAFAHTGGHGEAESGIPGVGAGYPGKWQKGRHGEQFYEDDGGGHHMHGIDGVIRAVGSSMLEHGINISGKEIVQKAIELHNQQHDSKNHLPNADAVDWRKINLSPLVEQDHAVRSNHNENGLITTYTNGHGADHKYGTYLESYAVPFNTQLEQAMSEAGHPNPRKHSWVKKPYVKPHRLHLVPDGQGGMMFGAQAVGSGKLEADGGVENEMSKLWGDRIPDNRAFRDITSWGVAHHMPKVYYLPQSDHAPGARRGPQPRKQTVDSFVFQMMRAMGHDPEGRMNNTIVDSEGAKRYAAQTLGPNGIPLAASLVPPKLVDTGKRKKNGEPIMEWQGPMADLARHLSQYPAFQAVYGENRMPKFDEEGNQKGRPNTVGKLLHAYGQRYGDDAEEGRGLDMMMSHSARVDNFTGHQHTTKVAHHARAKDNWSNAVLAASLGYNHAEDDMSPEELLAAGINLHDTPEMRDAAPEVKEMLDSIFRVNTIAGGHEHKELPTQEELAEIQPIISHIIQGGTAEDRSMLGVPDHIPYSEVLQPITPTAEAAPPPPTTLRGPPTGDAGHPMPDSRRGAAATQAPPPQSQVAVRPSPLQVDPNTPGLTPNQQMRARFGTAPMSEVRDVYTQHRRLPEGGLPTGAPSPGQSISEWGRTGLGTPEAAQEQRLREFQQNVGDPYQTFITDPRFTKADNVGRIVELLQIEEARLDGQVMKHVPNQTFNSDSIYDVQHVAKMMEISPLDVRTILHSQGDWERITKTYGYNDTVVKVVKVVFGGRL